MLHEPCQVAHGGLVAPVDVRVDPENLQQHDPRPAWVLPHEVEERGHDGPDASGWIVRASRQFRSQGGVQVCGQHVEHGRQQRFAVGEGFVEVALRQADLPAQRFHRRRPVALGAEDLEPGFQQGRPAPGYAHGLVLAPIGASLGGAVAGLHGIGHGFGRFLGKIAQWYRLGAASKVLT